jgi:hypothetical protein
MMSLFDMLSNMLGWPGGLARVQLCWILAKYSPLHHTSCSQIVHVRKLRFCQGGVSFFVASIHLPSCSLRNMISFVHRHVYELFDHFFENLNGFLNPYSRSSRFFVLNFTPFITLMSKVGCTRSFSFFSMCHLSNQEHSCLKCVPSTTRASHMKRQHPPPPQPASPQQSPGLSHPDGEDSPVQQGQEFLG